MADCQINGRLWTELYRNTPLYGLWMFVKHAPSGDSWMRGDSYRVIQQRIVELSGMDKEEVGRECDRLRAVKLKEEQSVKLFDETCDIKLKEKHPIKLVAETWDFCGEFGGGGWSCGILEENLFAE